MTPVILYNAAGFPVGPRAVVQVQRPTSSADTSPNYAAGVTPPQVANVVPFGSSGQAVGDPVEISELSISLNSETNRTTGVMGESKNDPNVMRGNPTLTIGTFIKSNGTPTFCPGDFIDLWVGMKITSTPGTPASIPKTRWVFTANSIGTGGPNKNSVTLELDRVNSDPALIEF